MRQFFPRPIISDITFTSAPLLDTPYDCFTPWALALSNCLDLLLSHGLALSLCCSGLLVTSSSTLTFPRFLVGFLHWEDSCVQLWGWLVLKRTGSCWFTLFSIFSIEHSWYLNWKCVKVISLFDPKESIYLMTVLTSHVSEYLGWGGRSWNTPVRTPVTNGCSPKLCPSTFSWTDEMADLKDLNDLYWFPSLNL